MSVYDMYTNVGVSHDNDPDVEPGCKSVDFLSPCSHHYRSCLLDSWDSLDISEVRVVLDHHYITDDQV
jgi:hypothetical protein